MKCKSRPLLLQMLAEGYCKSIENAKRLIDDGNVLIKNKRYVGAINSLRLAIEEIAKALLMNQAALFKKDDKQKWEWFWEVFFNHKKSLNY